MITVNGLPVELNGSRNLLEFLNEQGYDQRVIVIGLNDKIVPKGTYPGIVLKDNDVLDVLHFVSGG
ncbi:MAG: sulfur carrier protein ThiS [Clostridiales Family XIII bacterium]|nr:sulfur carrier protein ThiS [Clostridiales Family XIII bacterium]